MNIEENSKILFPFRNVYNRENPLDIRDLFLNPNRDVYGYLWKDIYTRSVKQTLRYRKNYKLSGIYINSKEDYPVLIGILNRNFLLSTRSNYDKWSNMINESGGENLVWELLCGRIRKYLDEYQIPMKKYLAEKKPKSLWVNLNEYDITKKDPIYYDFVCGIETIEINTTDSVVFSYDLLNETAENGILKNLGVFMFDDFFENFPSIITRLPYSILQKMNMEKWDQIYNMSTYWF